MSVMSAIPGEGSGVLAVRPSPPLAPLTGGRRAADGAGESGERHAAVGR